MHNDFGKTFGLPLFNFICQFEYISDWFIYAFFSSTMYIIQMYNVHTLYGRFIRPVQETTDATIFIVR